MPRVPFIGWVAVAILALSPFLSQGGEACTMAGLSGPQLLAAPDCCCGPGCQCCQVSKPPQTPLPEGSKAPQGNHSQEAVSLGGAGEITVLADVLPAPTSENSAPPSGRPVYLLTRHFRN